MLHSNCLLLLAPYCQNLIHQHLGIEKLSTYLLFERYILVFLQSVNLCCFILKGIFFSKDMDLHGCQFFVYIRLKDELQ